MGILTIAGAWEHWYRFDLLSASLSSNRHLVSPPSRPGGPATGNETHAAYSSFERRCFEKELTATRQRWRNPTSAKPSDRPLSPTESPPYRPHPIDAPVFPRRSL